MLAIVGGARGARTAFFGGPFFVFLRTFPLFPVPGTTQVTLPTTDNRTTRLGGAAQFRLPQVNPCLNLAPRLPSAR